MARYILKRLAWSAFLCVAVTFLTFVVFYVIPGDPGRLVLGQQRNPSPEDIERANRLLGTDDPIYVQYGRFLWKLLHGDFGLSFNTPARRVPVGEALRDAALVTGSLVVVGLLLVVLIGAAIGSYAAMRPRSRPAKALGLLTLLGLALPPIVSGYVLQYLFAAKLDLLPRRGYCAFFDSAGGCGPVGWASHLVLPWVCFALVFTALYARMFRASVLDVVNEPYVRTAWAKGAPGWRVLRSHVLRNALLPIVTLIAMDLGTALGVAIYVEYIFSLPGLGSVALGAVSGFVGFDLPFIVGIVLVTSIGILLLNLVADLLYMYLDPRIELVGRDRLARAGL